MNELLIELTADIVASQAANNSVPIDSIPNLIKQVHDALAALSQPAREKEAPKDPKVSVKASVKPDYLVCLECGARLKMLKRHLRSRHELTSDQYRQQFGLSHSYPMVASNYAETRRTLAIKAGLGRKAGTKVAKKAKGTKSRS